MSPQGVFSKVCKWGRGGGARLHASFQSHFSFSSLQLFPCESKMSPTPPKYIFSYVSSRVSLRNCFGSNGFNVPNVKSIGNTPGKCCVWHFAAPPQTFASRLDFQIARRPLNVFGSRANVQTQRHEGGMNAEIQLGRMMSFMNDFTPAPSEALSLHSVTASTVFSFPLESNVYCVISAAHSLTRGHVASLRLNCGWLIEQIILLCVFGIKGCFRHSQCFLGVWSIALAGESGA